MTLDEVRKVLNATVLVGEDKMHVEVTTAFASDLMSDVLAFAKEGSLLLTGITNPQVIRTAEILDLLGIVFVRGKVPDKDTIALAKHIDFPLLSTKYILFEACGKLYKYGIIGCIEKVG